MPYNDFFKKLHENNVKLKAFGVKKIGVFGYYVRSEEHLESDVDILVEFGSGWKTFDNYMGLKFFLEDLLGKKVDLVVSESVKPELKESVLASVKYA